MGSDDLLKLETWIDASHAVHDYMRGHTGECMSYVFGIIHSKESKQKLNTKIATESEVVAVSEYVPYKIHIIHIFGGQGYALHKNILYQDNKSEIII